MTPARDSHLQFLRFAPCIGDIHIKAYPFREPETQHSVHDRIDCAGALSEIRIGVMVGERESDRRYSESTSLASGTHCAGIQLIHRGIRTMVDACHHKIRTAVEDMVHCKLNAIHRRSRHTIHLRTFKIRHLSDAKGIIDGNGHRLSRTRGIRAYSHYIAEFYKTADKFLYSFCIYAVVIGDEY